MRVKSVSGRVKTPKMKLTAAQKKTRLINDLFKISQFVQSIKPQNHV